MSRPHDTQRPGRRPGTGRRTSSVGPTIGLVVGLILMLGAGALVGISKFGGRLPGGSAAAELDAEPTTTASTPQTSAELLEYVRAGTSVDPTPYLLPGNSEPVYGFYTSGQSVECHLDSIMYLLLCTMPESAWPDAQRPADCAETQNWSPETILVNLADPVRYGVRRGNCYDTGGGSPQHASAVLEHGQTISAGGFVCRSESSYLACVYEQTGDGFVMGHDSYTLVGTVAS